MKNILSSFYPRNLQSNTIKPAGFIRIMVHAIVFRFIFPIQAATLTFVGAAIVQPAYAEELLTAPLPAWLAKRDLDVSSFRVNAKDGGSQFILNDSQSLYNDDKPHFYTRIVVRLNSLQAIEQLGSMSVQYFPAYQTYQIHHLKIWREGVALDVLNDVKVTFNRNEVAAGTPPHEGISTVLLFIPDIRRGDVIDFSHSIIGQNTAFGERATGAISLASQVDAYNTYLRYLVPEERPLTFTYFKDFKPPKITKKNGQIIYDWMWDLIETANPEVNTPDWYYQSPTLIFSDYINWEEVKDWAYNLFSLPEVEGETISSLVAWLVKDINTKEEKLKAILAFMQSEIRYVGMEIGRNGFRPFAPFEVLERRYGDCKDQSVLLQSLLKEAGIKAWPALVNSSGGKLIETLGATPAAFDHAIVMVEINDKTYWVDPTRSLTNKKNVYLTPPRFGKALVLKEGETNLTDIPLKEKTEDLPHIQTTDHFDLSNGLYGEANWIRQTKYTGDFAEVWRQAIENYGLRRLGKGLRKVHEKRYEGDLTSNELISIEDDGETLTVIEDYKIPKPAKFDEEENRNIFRYKARNISQVLKTPSDIKTRQTPFALTYPLRRQTTLILVVPHILLDPYEDEIISPYHIYRQRRSYVDGVFQIEYEYETLQDHVPVKDIEAFSDEIEQIYDDLSYRVWWHGTAQSEKKALEWGGLENDSFPPTRPLLTPEMLTPKIILTPP